MNDQQGLRAYADYLLQAWAHRDSPLLREDQLVSDVYVEPIVEPNAPLLAVLSDRARSRARVGDLTLAEIIEPPPVGSLVLVVGPAGIGKSTVLAHAAALRSRSFLNGQSATLAILLAAPDLVRGTVQFGLGSVRVILEALGEDIGIGANLGDLLLDGEITPDLLIDGLDEIPSSSQREVLDRLSTAVKSGRVRSCFVMSRDYGWHHSAAVPRALILGLDASGRRELLRLIARDEVARRVLPRLSYGDLQELGWNPLFVTLLAVAGAEEALGSAVRSADLGSIMQEATTALLAGAHRQGHSVASISGAHRILRSVSLEAHRWSLENNSEFIPTVDLCRFADLRVPVPVSSWPDGRAALDEISNVSGILTPTSKRDDTRAYFHRSIREYYSACELTDLWVDPGDDITADLGQEPQAWTGVLRFLTAGASIRERLLDSLIPSLDPAWIPVVSSADNLTASLAKKALEAPMPDDARLQVGLLRNIALRLAPGLDRASVVLPFLAETEVSPTALGFLTCWGQGLGSETILAAVRDAMDRLHPPEPGVLGQPYTPGDSSEYFAPPRQDLPGMAIDLARFAVTNRQYEAFAGRVSSPFVDLVATEDLAWHPVVDVNWYESIAFSAWVAGSVGQRVTLPASYIWLLAAIRPNEGSHGVVYPWGAEDTASRANVWRSGPNRTERVDAYPDGRSATGIYNLVGNVWEWCLEPTGAVGPNSTVVRSLQCVGNGWTDARRINRGGGWYYDVEEPNSGTVAADYASSSFTHCGIRLMRMTGS